MTISTSRLSRVGLTLAASGALVIAGLGYAPAAFADEPTAAGTSETAAPQPAAGTSAAEGGAASETTPTPTSASEPSETPQATQAPDGAAVTPVEITKKPQNVQVRAGETATFHLEFTAPDGAVVRWQSAPRTTAEVLTANGQGLDEIASFTRPVGTEETQEWADVDAVTNPTAITDSLQLATLTAADSGTIYRAIVTVGDVETVSTLASLVVLTDDEAATAPTTGNESAPDASASAEASEPESTQPTNGALAARSASTFALALPAASKEGADDPTQAAPFANDRIWGVAPIDKNYDPTRDALVPNLQSLDISGGGVSAAVRPGYSNSAKYRPTWAYRWSETDEWTWDHAITSAAYTQVLRVSPPALAPGAAPEARTLEVIVAYKAVDSLPMQTLNYWKAPTTFLVAPEPENLKPTITETISDRTVKEGDSVTFKVGVRGYDNGRMPFVSQVFVTTKESVDRLNPIYSVKNGDLGEEFANAGAGPVYDMAHVQQSYEYTIAHVTPEMDGMKIDFDGEGFDSRGWNYESTLSSAILHVEYQQSPSDWKPPVVTLDPISVSESPDEWGTLSVELTSASSGTPKANVQWQRLLPGGSWEDLPNSATLSSRMPTLYLQGSDAITQAQSGVQFRAKWTNRLGVAYSKTATILLRGALPEGQYWGESDTSVKFSVPTGVEVGGTLTVSGKSWKNTSLKSTGSVIAVRVEGLESDGTLTNPVTGAPITDRSIVAVAKANSVGSWSAQVSTPADWTSGVDHKVTLSSGELIEGDTARNETASFVVWPIAEVATFTQNLPDHVELTEKEGFSLHIGAAAPTPVTYEWQLKKPASDEWIALPETQYVSDDNTTLTVPSLSENSGVHALRFVGAQLRVAATTMKGTVYSDPVRVDVQTTAQLHYDTSKPHTVGSTLTVEASGLRAETTYSLEIGENVFANLQTDTEGSFSGDVTIPAIAGNPYGRAEPIDPAKTYRILAFEPTPANGTPRPVAVGDALSIQWDSSVKAPTINGLAAETRIPEGETVTLSPSPQGENIEYLWTMETKDRNLQADRNATFDVTGTLRPEPAYSDGATATVRVWNAGGFAQSTTKIVVVPSDGSPAGYDYVTATTDDGAVAWIEQNAKPGGTIRVSGHNWRNAEKTKGSVLALKLNYRYENDETGQYERTGSDIVTQPLNGSPDSTIWKLIYADSNGDFSLTVDLPQELVTGQRLAVALSSGVFAENDVQRMVVSPSLIVNGVPWEEPPVEVVVCTPSSKYPEVTVAKSVSEDGTLHVEGTGWCNRRTGGSTIAIKIDDGVYSHLDKSLNSNLTVWAIAYADDETGDWSIDMPLPNGTTSGDNGSTPAIGEGEHWLRFLTGSLKDYDPIRTYGTPSGYNTSFVIGQYRPNGVPAPLEYHEDLSDGVQHGVTVTRSGTNLNVHVPGGHAGDWVYLSLYVEDGSSRLPWGGTWFHLDANGNVTASLEGITLPVGKLKVVVQNGNEGHKGELLGWNWLTVSPPGEDTSGSTEQIASATDEQAANRPLQVTPQLPQFSLAPRSQQKTAPNTVPAAPFPNEAGLTAANMGGLTAVQEGTVVTITMPNTAPGSSVYLYVYSTPIPVGWIEVDGNHQVKIDLKGLPAGEHRIAVLNQDGSLIGWVSALLEGGLAGGSGGSGNTVTTQAQGAAAGATPLAFGFFSDADMLMLGGSAGILAALILVVVLVQRRRESAAGRSAAK